MESLVSTTSTASRDILAEELTNLRSLLRLNADGIGDEADLISQLNQTRAAIDQFYSVLCERRDLLVTPETLPPGSPTSSIATSPRLSFDSIPASWRSSRTSQLSLSMGEGAELPKKLGLVDELRAAEGGPGVVEDWHLEMGSLLEDGPTASDTGEGRVDFSDDAEDGNMGVQDEAFKRLSDLLASLQSQAEAAISNPTTSFNDDGAAVDGIDNTEEYQFPMIPKPKARKRISLRESDVHSFSSSKSDQLLRASLRASFRRTNSLPYPPHWTSSISSISSISSMPDRPRIITTDSCDPGTGEHTPLSPIGRSSTEPIDPISNGNHIIHRRVNSTSLLSLPSKRYSRSLMSSPPPSGLSTAIHSGCSSPRSMSMSRRGSYLIKDMGIEGLLGELIEMGNRANQTVLEHQGFMTWVWALLAGGGVLWLAVGWTLKWNCQCQCPQGVR